MNISGPFVRRPVATSLLALAILLTGAGAYTQLPVAPLPRVDFPTIAVSAALPGASPETMASTIATPLERRLNRIAGLEELTSTSSLGATSITLQFDLDRDIDAAARDVQAAINAAGGDLPPNLPTRPSYKKVNPADHSILILSLWSDAVPLAQVYQAANTILAPRIAQVDGVGQVFVGGGQQPAVRVQVDPLALAGMGLSLEDVRNVLATSTVDQPIGALSNQAQLRTLAANDQLEHASAFQSLVLAYQNGAAVRLGDVAHVYDDVENNRVAAWTNGRRSVLVLIRRQPGANIMEVVARVKKLLPQLASSISPAIHVDVTLDRSRNIRASVDDVQLTLVMSILLVVFVVFLFLRSGWATTVPSVAVPLSLVGTFGFMYLLGYSLDNLSLMALTISTGFVVDDAIVVTENVARLIEDGLPPHFAALEGARQIGFTIVSITLSLLAVFIPILFMGGIVGRLFREFAVTLSIAIAVSAVVSLTLTPMLCSRVLRPASEQRHGRLYTGSERVFAALLAFYGRGLRWVLRHRRFVGAMTLLTLALSIALYIVVPKGLFPQQDTGQLAGFSEAPQDISFPAMLARQKRVNEVVKADPDVAFFVSFIGGGWGASSNTGTVYIELAPTPSRRATADQVIARLRPKLAQVEGIKLFLQSVQDVRVGGRASRTQYQYTLQDQNIAELTTWAPRVFDRLKQLPELKDVATDQQTNGLELVLDLDRDSAATLGIKPSDLDNALYDAYGQRQVATIYTGMDQYRVVLEVAPEYQRNPDSLQSIYVPTPDHGQVPLTQIVKHRLQPMALAVNHQGQFPCVTMSFNLAPGVALGQAVEAIRRAELQLGLPASVHADFQGTAAVFRQSLASEPMLILFALITVYIVLGVLYESLVHPVTILSTLPSAGVGALLALLLFHAELSIIALIGIILLIGIVKKNAIMMIDVAIVEERTHGLPPEEAIHRACMLRFRPILMTSLAALFGGLPLALGNGVGSELRRPLGIAIVGGLLVSQVLTLYMTPVVYLALDRFTRSRRAHGSHGADELAVPLSAKLGQ